MKVTIENPCPADWRAMSGDTKRRFCGQCKKHVHNLSEMTETEASELVSGKQELCVRYVPKKNGSVGFRPSKVATWFFVAAATSATACGANTEAHEPEGLALETILEEEGLTQAWVPPEPECESSRVEDSVEAVVVKAKTLKPVLAELFSGAATGLSGGSGLQEIGTFRHEPGIAGGMVISTRPVPPKPPALVVSEPVDEVEPEAEEEKPRRRKKKRPGK